MFATNLACSVPNKNLLRVDNGRDGRSTSRCGSRLNINEMSGSRLSINKVGSGSRSNINEDCFKVS